MTKSVNQSEAELQDALNDMDWVVLQVCSADISEFTEVTYSFINTLANKIIPTATIWTFSNQKPKIDRFIWVAVNAHTAEYNGLLQREWVERYFQGTAPTACGTV